MTHRLNLILLALLLAQVTLPPDTVQAQSLSIGLGGVRYNAYGQGGYGGYGRSYYGSPGAYGGYSGYGRGYSGYFPNQYRYPSSGYGLGNGYRLPPNSGYGYSGNSYYNGYGDSGYYSQSYSPYGTGVYYDGNW